MLYGKVTSVTFVEKIEKGLDICKIRIDFDELHIFGDYTEIAEYMNKDVQYDVRKDMYKGEVIKIVANVVQKQIIQSAPAIKDVVLIPPFDFERAVANFSIDEIRFGDTKIGCVGLVADWEPGSSSRSTWVDITIVDKLSKAFKLRRFTNRLDEEVDIESYMNEQLGTYIQFDLEYTRYGYQTNIIHPLSMKAVPPPEVSIAKNIIAKGIAADEQCEMFMRETKMMDRLESVLYYEPGYHLVNIAAEFIMIGALSNVSRSYDVQLMKRTALASRLYATTPAGKTYSRPIANVMGVLKTCLAKDKDLLLMLDAVAPSQGAEKSTYIFINQFVNKVFDERRGIKDEESSTAAINHSMYEQFGGLFSERK